MSIPRPRFILKKKNGGVKPKNDVPAIFGSSRWLWNSSVRQKWLGQKEVRHPYRSTALMSEPIGPKLTLPIRCTTAVA